MDKKTFFVNTKNARPGEHYESVIKSINAESVCPFCPENISRYHKNKLKVKKFWLVTDNMYPYASTKHHILLIHKKHLADAGKLTSSAWNELHKIIKSETKEKNIGGGTMLFRFGDSQFNGASVNHLHVHLIQSNPNDPAYKKPKRFSEGVVARVG
jgi:diadenosine tetraphosphate (Ap4A) HIT family hydrolase